MGVHIEQVNEAVNWVQYAFDIVTDCAVNLRKDIL